MSYAKQEYDYLIDTYPTLLESFSSLSKTKTGNDFIDGSEFIYSDLKMINFDSLAKKLGSNVCSPDGLFCDPIQDELIFIELKNQDWDNFDFKKYKSKIYEGISVLSAFTLDSNNDTESINISCYILFNPNHSKNLNRNLAHLKLVENSRIATLEKFFKGFKKFKICIKFDFICNDNELNKFIYNLEKIIL